MVESSFLDEDPDKLAVLTRTVLMAIHRRVSTAAPELAPRWALEQALVHERHVRSIGPSLVRGAAVESRATARWAAEGWRSVP